MSDIVKKRVNKAKNSEYKFQWTKILWEFIECKLFCAITTSPQDKSIYFLFFFIFFYLFIFLFLFFLFFLFYIAPE